VLGKDRVHACSCCWNPARNADEIVRQANQRLEDHQKIRDRISIWAGQELPRTQTTRKLRRAEIAEVVEKGVASSTPPPENALA